MVEQCDHACLMDEPVPDGMAAFLQRDIICLAELLSNFDIFDEEGKQSRFGTDDL